MAASNKALPTPFPRNSCGTYIPQITPLWRFLISPSLWKPAMPTRVFPSKAPKVASSGAASLLRSPCVTPAIPLSSISSFIILSLQKAGVKNLYITVLSQIQSLPPTVQSQLQALVHTSTHRKAAISALELQAQLDALSPFAIPSDRRK